MTTTDIEIAITKHFNSRRNLIVPNVCWGWGLKYEADIVVVSPANIAFEIEIKTSLADLKQENKKKKHAHRDKRFKFFYFVLPAELFCKLQQNDKLIDDEAGVYIVLKNGCLRLMKAPKLKWGWRKITEKE